MCGTDQPGTRDFERVVCSQGPLPWRAIAVVPFPAGDYPGEQKVREAGQSPCQDAGASVARTARLRVGLRVADRRAVA